MKRREFIKSVIVGTAAISVPLVVSAAWKPLPVVEEMWLGLGRIINHSDEMIEINVSDPEACVIWRGYITPKGYIDLANIHSNYPLGGGRSKAFVTRNGKRIEVPIMNHWSRATPAEGTPTPFGYSRLGKGPIKLQVADERGKLYTVKWTERI